MTDIVRWMMIELRIYNYIVAIIYIYTKTRNRWTMVKHHISQYPKLSFLEILQEGAYEKQTQTQTHGPIFDSPQDFFFCWVWYGYCPIAKEYRIHLSKMFGS